MVAFEVSVVTFDVSIDTKEHETAVFARVPESAMEYSRVSTNQRVWHEANCWRLGA